MKYFTDPQTQEVIHCERCDRWPATHELTYEDPNYPGEDACDFVCEYCLINAAHEETRAMNTEDE